MTNSIQGKTPKSLGFRFPAEWEKHAATWLTYPQNPESWPENLSKVWKAFNQFIKVVSSAEEVHVNVNDKITLLRIQKELTDLGCLMDRIYFHEFVSDDCWCRDHGPAFLVGPDSSKALIDWEFNAWGNKYESTNDNRIATQIAQYTGIKRFAPGIIMEGGSIEVNGKGTLLTSRACLLNNNRNPGASIHKIEEYLKEYYCVEQILWLGDGVAGDDTDGHIDDIARFANESTLLLAIEKDKSSINYKPLQQNLEIARQFKLFDGTRPEIIELPMPSPQLLNGELLPASYANFYICNAGVIVPVFNCKQDEEAVKILSEVFQNREIIPIDATDVIHGLGSWHCLSQQEPMGKGI